MHNPMTETIRGIPNIATPKTPNRYKDFDEGDEQKPLLERTEN